MKLGIFDSGLGGLVIAKAIRDYIPDIDIVYLGDTLRLPYGSRSRNAIYNFTKRAVTKLFELDCALIIIACNTASAASLRQLQQNWLPHHYPDRNILGVIVPTVEDAINKNYKKLGVIGTSYIISSGVYSDELKKINPEIELVQTETPLLVPLIEHDGLMWAQDILNHYLDSFLKKNIECLLLGCTHYPLLKPYIQNIVGNDLCLLSQDDIIPYKLNDYLERHPAYKTKISYNAQNDFYVTDITKNYQKTAESIMGKSVHLEKVSI